MVRLLNLVGLVAFLLGAVGLALAAYILLTVGIGWNPFGRARPADLALTAMLWCGGGGIILLLLGAILARLSARIEWRREMQEIVAP